MKSHSESTDAARSGMDSQFCGSRRVWIGVVEKFVNDASIAPPFSRTGSTPTLPCAVRPIASPIRVAIEQHADVARAAHRFGRLDRIGDDQFLELRRGDARDRAARQHAVGDVGVDLVAPCSSSASAAFTSVPPESTMSSTRMQVWPCDLADHVHHFGFAGALAPLVDDGERRVDALGEAARAHHAADVGRHHRHACRGRSAP